jgi:uncharacterized protein YndB with AHSA1/START domain
VHSQTESGLDAPHLPSPLMREFDGDHLESRTQEAVRLSTLTQDGWPHAAYLSRGEILVVSPTTLLVMTWRNSQSTQNLNRNGRTTMGFVSEGAIVEVRGRAERLGMARDFPELNIFRIVAVSVKQHRAPYAEVSSGLTFTLHHPRETLNRWERQIVALRANCSAYQRALDRS